MEIEKQHVYLVVNNQSCIHNNCPNLLFISIYTAFKKHYLIKIGDQTGKKNQVHQNV